MRLVLIGWLLFSGMASGQTVYRCVQKGKPVSFQTERCASNARTTAAVAYVPNPEAAPSVRRAAVQREMDQRNSMARSAVHIVEATRPNPDGISCAAAKDARDAWERQHPLARNVETLRRWQEFVFNHCR